jgi:adenosylcobinamide hydrolase
MRRPAGLRTRFRLVGRTLLVDLGAVRPVLSSAPRGGGLSHVRFILNHQVPANPIGLAPRRSACAWKDPARYLGRVAAAAGAEGPSVGLMTAVPLAKLVTVRRRAGSLWVEGLFTVGVSNAVRAGEPPVASPRVRAAGPGTINMILVTNARLAASAMVCAVQVATEAKTAALLAAKVRSWTGRPGATGTGTDAVVIVSGDGPSLRYSGTHTALGALIGQVVASGVAAGLARWRAARPRRC